MTERTIKQMAKELAGQFYEGNRTPGFRATFPTLQAYMRGHWHNADGTVTYTTAGWHHHVVLARKLLTLMLGQPDARVSPHMKESIYDALLEDHAKSTLPGAANINQRLN